MRCATVLLFFLSLTHSLTHSTHVHLTNFFEPQTFHSVPTHSIPTQAVSLPFFNITITMYMFALPLWVCVFVRLRARGVRWVSGRLRAFFCLLALRLGLQQWPECLGWSCVRGLRSCMDTVWALVAHSCSQCVLALYPLHFFLLRWCADSNYLRLVYYICCVRECTDTLSVWGCAWWIIGFFLLLHSF